MMAFEQRQRELFRAIKPHTVSLLDRSIDGRGSLKALESELRAYEPDVVRGLGDYVLFPLVMLLRDAGAREGEVEQVLGVLSVLFESGAVIPQADVLLVDLVASLARTAQRADVSDEPVKELIARCLLSIFTARSDVTRLLSSDMSLVMSLALSSLLDVASGSASIAARVSSLDASRAWLDLIATHAPDRVLAVLPGIVTSCASILRRDDKTPQRILVGSLSLLEAALLSTLSDALNEPILPPPPPSSSADFGAFFASLRADATPTSSERALEKASPSPAKADDRRRGPPPPAVRDRAWLDKTSERIGNVLNHILPPLTLHSSESVRAAVAHLASAVMCECALSVGGVSVSRLADALVSLSADDGGRLLNATAERLRARGFVFADVVAGLLSSRISSLFKTILAAAHDDAKLLAIRCAAGYLELAGDLARPAVTVAVMDSAVDILDALQMRQKYHMTIVAEVPPSLAESGASAGDVGALLARMPSVRFRHIGADAAGVALLKDVVQRIGAVADVDSLVDHFVGFFSGAHADAALLFCAHLVAGAHGSPRGAASQCAYQLLDAALRSPAWESREADDDGERLVALLRAVAVSALCVDAAVLEVQLLRCLYPLLCCAQDAHPRVVIAAQCALEAVAFAAGARDPAAVILDRVDYIAHAISTRVGHVTRASGQSALAVMCAALRTAGLRVAPFLEDAVRDLLDVLDEQHAQTDVPLMVIVPLNAYVAVVGAHFETLAAQQQQQNMKKDQVDQMQSESDDEEEIGDAARGFAAHHRKRAMAADTPEDDQAAVADAMASDDSSDPLKLLSAVDRRLYATVKYLVERMSALLSAPSAKLQGAVLALVRASLPVLGVSRTELRPLLHSMWGSIVRRLDASDGGASADEAAISFLHHLLLQEDDFFHSRVETDVLPRVMSRLPSLLANIDGQSAIDTFSAPFRLAAAMLRFLTALFDAPWFAPTYETLGRYADAAVPALDDRAARALQQLALDYYHALARHDADFVWAFAQRLAASDALAVLYAGAAAAGKGSRTIQYSEAAAVTQSAADHAQKATAGVAGLLLDVGQGMERGKVSRAVVQRKAEQRVDPKMIEEALRVPRSKEPAVYWSLLPSKWARTLTGRLHGNARAISERLERQFCN